MTHLWIVLFLLVSFQSVQSAESPAPIAIKIVAFGDSTTARRGSLKTYSDQLRDLFADSEETVEIINAGVGGNHTDLAMKRFDRDVLQHDPDVVIIQFGINDAAIDVWKNPPATKPRVSLDRYSKNLSDFIKQLRARKTRHVVLMTPNPLTWTERLKQLYGKHPYKPDDANGFNVVLETYADEVRRVAAKHKVPLIDVDLAFKQYAEQPSQSIDDLLLDGMHPNEQGHKLISNLLFSELKEQIEQLRFSQTE